MEPEKGARLGEAAAHGLGISPSRCRHEHPVSIDVTGYRLERES